MHKIDSAGQVDGRFVAGNPITGTPPTSFTADWSNAVQEEIANVIVGAGIDLDKADNTQLLLAINALIDAKLQNFTGTGGTDTSGGTSSNANGTSFQVNAIGDLIYETDGQYAPLADVNFSIQNGDLVANSATALPTMSITNNGELEVTE